MNIWHDIEPTLIAPERFTAVIEIPAGSKKKYELDKNTGLLRLDRILYTSTRYPANYGFIPRTYADDEDPLDVLVYCSEILDPLVMVDCHPIGVLRMIDNKQFDDKIIAVPCDDPTWNFFHDIEQLPPHRSTEMAHFFEVYKSLEHTETYPTQVLGKESALDIIRDCMDRYLFHFCGKRRREESALPGEWDAAKEGEKSGKEDKTAKVAKPEAKTKE